MSTPEYFAARIRGASTYKEVTSLIQEAEAADLGTPGIKSLKRSGQVRIREIKAKSMLEKHWHRQHRVNGAQQCQPAIASTEASDELRLVLDPYGQETGVKHKDPNAIALYNDKGRVGYISAKADQFGDREGGLAKWLSQRIKSGEKWTALVVAKVGQGKASLGLRIELVQTEGIRPMDWPDDVDVENEPIREPEPIDIPAMDLKLKDLWIHRNLLAPEAKKKFLKIRSFRVKYGRYSENCMNWLDEQKRNLQILLAI